MAPNTDARYPSRLTFVVKLRGDSGPGELRGRVENLLSCEQREFVSAPELIALIEAELRTPPSAGGDPG